MKPGELLSLGVDNPAHTYRTMDGELGTLLAEIEAVGFAHLGFVSWAGAISPKVPAK